MQNYAKKKCHEVQESVKKPKYKENKKKYKKNVRHYVSGHIAL